jgi:deazaflavin-dependent oxidoreductase (nitroreductase family)
MAVPTLLLTTLGRRTRQERVIPLVYVRDGERYIVGNARPGGEGKNPWVLNLRAAGYGRIRIRGRTVRVMARELDEAAPEHWWPHVVETWPAFGEHYAATGERTMFAITPTDELGHGG